MPPAVTRTRGAEAICHRGARSDLRVLTVWGERCQNRGGDRSTAERGRAKWFQTLGDGARVLPRVRVLQRRRRARNVMMACIAAAGRMTAGRGGSMIRPCRMLAAVTATTGAAQTVSAATRNPVRGSWCSEYHVQNAASARESAAAPKDVVLSVARARCPSSRSVASATTPTHRPRRRPEAGRFARTRVSTFGAPRLRRGPSMPRWVTESAQLVAIQRRPLRGAVVSRTQCSSVASVNARGRSWACRADRWQARARKRAHALGRQRPARRPASRRLVAARLSGSSMTAFAGTR